MHLSAPQTSQTIVWPIIITYEGVAGPEQEFQSTEVAPKRWLSLSSDRSVDDIIIQNL